MLWSFIDSDQNIPWLNFHSYPLSLHCSILQLFACIVSLSIHQSRKSNYGHTQLKYPTIVVDEFYFVCLRLTRSHNQAACILRGYSFVVNDYYQHKKMSVTVIILCVCV